MAPGPRRCSWSRGRARTPRPRPRRTGLGRSSASLEPDPDLLSFDHALLAIEAVIAAGLERPGQGLSLDVIGVALDRAHEHAISVVARVDAVLHIELESLAQVLDLAHDLARQAFELEGLGDLRVQLDLGGAKGHALDVQLVADDGDDVLGQRISWQRDRSERLADLEPGGIARRQSRLYPLARPRHIGFHLSVLDADGLGEIRQVNRGAIPEVAKDRVRREWREGGHQ